MPKFAANLTTMFCELPFLERFEAASRAGFRAVEYLWPYDYAPCEIKRLLDTYKLKQVLFNTPAGEVSKGEWGVAALPDKKQQAREHIALALDYARALNCPNIHLMAGVVPDELLRSEYEQCFIENVRFAADLFKPYGIKVMIEALSPEVKEHYLLKSQFDSLRMVKVAKRENVLIQLDYFHAHNVDGKLSALTEALFPFIGHIQIASVPYRCEPDQGEINYQYLFDRLDLLGYLGYIGLEYQPRAGTLQGLQWFEPYRA